MNLLGHGDYVVFYPMHLTLFSSGLNCFVQGEFVDDGTETHFSVGDHECCIKATSGGRKKSGIVHYLLLDGETMPAL